MIRKLQKLRAKKGFTLVELLVVIAIIGVLAAILIPLMNNYLRSARIQSANSTAASARNTLTGWMQDDAMRNRGLLTGNETIAVIATNGTFAVTGVTEANWAGYPITGGNDDGSNQTATQALTIALTTAFPDMQTGSFAFYLTDGYCASAVYVAGVADVAAGTNILPYIAADGSIVNVVAGRAESTETPATLTGTGVGAAGTIVGTSPQQP